MIHPGTRYRAVLQSLVIVVVRGCSTCCCCCGCCCSCLSLLSFSPRQDYISAADLDRALRLLGEELKEQVRST